MNPRIDYLKSKTSSLTNSPGVYLMKNEKNKIIYVGKAKNLINRVSSYFFSNNHIPKVELMINDVFDFDFITTQSEYEALILECNLIKKHKPQYNILLMDDKSYTYIFISSIDYPRLTLKKQRDERGKYFGPYISTSYSRLLLNEANDLFKLPTCKRNFEKNSQRPCLRYHMNKCQGYCRGSFSKSEYSDIVDDAVLFLQSGYKETLKKLHNEMLESAEKLNFERSIYLRDRLKAIDSIQSSQVVIDNYYSNCDVIAFAKSDAEICISVLIYRKGNIADKALYYFEDSVIDENFWESFIVQHYLNYKNIPDKIILPEYFGGDISLLIDFFNISFFKNVKVISARSGTSKNLYELALKNAIEHITVKHEKNNKNTHILTEIYKSLDLEYFPNYIESYDISNLGDSVIVAGMVVFENGEPLKRAYKHFNLPQDMGQNDFECMYHILKRRLIHIGNDKKDMFFNKKPDLILIDGGVQHLKFVQRAFDELDIDNISLFGMVKNSKHRTRALVDLNGNEVSIRNNLEVFNFFTRIQDEVHRFSISYMKRKNKSRYQSEILNVKGIGEVKLKKLMSKYRTLKSIKEAEPSDIQKLISVNDDVMKDLIKVINTL